MLSESMVCNSIAPCGVMLSLLVLIFYHNFMLAFKANLASFQIDGNVFFNINSDILFVALLT